MKNLYLTLLLILAFALNVQAQSSSSLYKAGEKAAENGDYKTAIELLEKAVEQERKKGAKYPLRYAEYLNELGEYYRVSGRYEDSEKCHLEAIEIRKNILGKNHKDYGTSLSNLGSVYMDMSEYEKAEPLMLETCEIYKKNFGEDHLDYAISIENLGVLYLEMKRYNEAGLLILKSVEIEKKKNGENNLSYAKSLNNLASLYEEMGDYKKAEVTYFQIRDIRKSLLGENHPLYAETIKNLGNLYLKKKEYNIAEPLLQEAVGINKKAYGNNNSTYISSLNDLVNLYAVTIRLKEAEPLLEEVFEYRKNNIEEDVFGYLNNLNNLARIYGYNGKLEKAIPLFRMAINIERQSAKDKYRTDNLRSLGNLFVMAGRYREAEPLLQEVVEININEFGEQHPEYANAVKQLAFLYYSMGSNEEADSLYQHLTAILDKQEGGTNLDMEVIMREMAKNYQGMGRYEEAEALFRGLTEGRKGLPENNHTPSYVASLYNLAELYKSTGRYKEAEALLIQVKKIREGEVGKSFYPTQMDILYSLADLYEATGRLKQTGPFYEKAVELETNKVGENYMAMANAKIKLAKFYTRLSRYKEAESILLEVKELLNSHLNPKNHLHIPVFITIARLYDAMEKPEAALEYYSKAWSIIMQEDWADYERLTVKQKGQHDKTFLDFQNAFYPFVLKHAANNPACTADAYNKIVFTKERRMNSLEKLRETIKNSEDTLLNHVFNFYNSSKDYVARVYNEPLLIQEDLKYQVDSVENQLNLLSKYLLKKNKYFPGNSDKTNYHWASVRQKLKSGEAAIEMVRLENSDQIQKDAVIYLAFIIRPESGDFPEILALENGNELEGKYLEEYRKSIQNQSRDQQSYQQYWGKIGKMLEGTKKVYLSGDGVYHSLNLQALLNPATGKYLGEELEIQLLTSTKTLATPLRKRKPANEAYLLGSSDFHLAQELEKYKLIKDHALTLSYRKRSGSSVFHEGKIVSLKESDAGLQELARCLEIAGIRKNVYLGAVSTERRLKQIKNPKILHLNTHGFFMQNISSKPDNQVDLLDLQKGLDFQDPLLRSGLFLSGAQAAIEVGGDGVLTASEAMNLWLDDTELVVLSGFDTGLGEVKNGEGIDALQAAFKAAGAQSVLMSLWPGNEKANQEFLSMFYENWLQKGEDKQNAFKNAQANLRKKYPHPYYWAAFVIVE